MKFILEINNKTSWKFSKKFFLDIFRDSIDLANIKHLKNEAIELSVALVSEEEIGRINFQYRKKNSPTDVLSFCEIEDLKNSCGTSITVDDNLFLGELILCPDYIAKNAKEDAESMDYALAYIFSHGVFHLLGFTHGEKMFSLQRRIAENFINKK